MCKLQATEKQVVLGRESARAQEPFWIKWFLSVDVPLLHSLAKRAPVNF